MPATRGGEGPLEKSSPLPGKMCWTWFKTIGHSSKNLGPSQKTLRPSWCPKLVTGLAVSWSAQNAESHRSHVHITLTVEHFKFHAFYIKCGLQRDLISSSSRLTLQTR